MAIYQFEDRVPEVSEDAYVSECATIIGDVTIGPGCFIGPGARIKGDYGRIIVGKETSIQENCVVHARPDKECRIGARVNVGHGAILHGCTIKDNAVIGMGSIVSDFAVVGEWAVIGEGALVPSKKDVPDKAIAVGVPIKLTGTVTEEWIGQWDGFKDRYVDLAKRYPRGLRRLD